MGDKREIPAWLGEPGIAVSTDDVWKPQIQEIPRPSQPWVTSAPETLAATAPTPRKPKPRRPPRRMAVALPLMILLSLLSAFFSWVSAEPLWLSVGHSLQGTATITRCDGDGLSRRCMGDFAAQEFRVAGIALLGLTKSAATVGTKIKAEMVNDRSARAYAGTSRPELFLRWLIGLTAVLLCGLATVWATGALRMPDARDRRAALATSVGAPLLIAVGFLAAAF